MEKPSAAVTSPLTEAPAHAGSANELIGTPSGDRVDRRAGDDAPAGGGGDRLSGGPVD